MTINSEKQRDYFFDNIKGFLIILVVFGHAIRYLAFKRNSTVLLGLFMLIYSFHMPLFIFISGFFSKKTNSSKLINLVCTYFLWQMIITPGFIAIFTNKTFIGYSKSFFEPYETHWYLVSLLIWRLITPTNGFFFAAITFIICFVYSYICTLKPIPQISKRLSSVPDKLFMEH